jgi:hypothetical protein
MILETIILASIALTYISAAIYIAFLRFAEIYQWFANRRSVSSRDRTRLGFTLQELMKNGDYKTVQGVFNSAQQVVEPGARSIISKQIDDEFASYHDNKALVVYE